MARQGDVLLIPVAGPVLGPENPERNKLTGRLVLAQGETSLHEHTIAESDAELIKQGERMLLAVHRETLLAVTETGTGRPLARHTPLRIGDGVYEVRIQRELQITPGGRVTRRVHD